MTQNGAGSELSYPRYEPPIDASEDLRLKPNQRPLIIGIGIVVVGIVVLLVLALGGGKDETTPAADTDQTVQPGKVDPPPAPPAHPDDQVGSAKDKATDKDNGPKPPVVAPASGSDEPVPESISIHVVSHPDGADVLLRGKPIGTTTLDTKIKRGTDKTTLTVHRAGFYDISREIDMGEDVDQEVTLKKLEEHAPAPPSVPVKVDPKHGSTTAPPHAADHRDPGHVPDHREPAHGSPGITAPHAGGAATVPTAPAVPAKKCQPPNAVDPFSTLPICKS
jgi:hypothetical protein